MEGGARDPVEAPVGFTRRTPPLPFQPHIQTLRRSGLGMLIASIFAAMLSPQKWISCPTAATRLPKERDRRSSAITRLGGIRRRRLGRSLVSYRVTERPPDRSRVADADSSGYGVGLSQRDNTATVGPKTKKAAY